MPRFTWKRLKMLSLIYSYALSVLKKQTKPKQNRVKQYFLTARVVKGSKIFFLVWINHFSTLYSMMIIIYFYCFHSEKLSVLEQTPPAVFGFFELLDRSEKKLEAGCCYPFKISPEMWRKENLRKGKVIALAFPCMSG